MGAHRRRRATQRHLLVVVLGLVWVVAACGGPSASPTAPSGVAATPTSSAASSGEVTRLFGYDRRQPLAMTTQQSREEADGITVASITYASPKGGEVPALLVLPSGRGPFPGVIVQHGMPDTKESMLPTGIDLARTGAVAILIDAPFNRPQQGRVRSDPLTFTPKDRDEQVQLIVDLRRAIDVLATRPDVDRARLAYVGVSYGAAMGGLLAGVEDRLTAYVLAVGDGGLVSHFTGPDDANRPEVQSFPAEQRERWLEAMRPIEPINFVGKAAPAALLFQAGRNDELIPEQDTRRYYQAASQPKELRWYDAGHFLNCAARRDMMAWLAGHIRIDPRRYRCAA
jgi:dienelactone hydrolase